MARSGEGWVADGQSLGAPFTAQAQAALRLVLEHTSDVVWLYGPDGTCEWVSPSIQGLLGYEPADLVGTRTSVVHPEDRDGALMAYQHALDRRDTNLRSRVRVVAADGAVRWVDASIDLWWQEGRLVRSVASMRDVTEQVAAQESAEAAREQYRMVAEHAGDYVTRTDIDGVIRWVSPSVTEVIGWRPEDLVGRVATEFADEEVRAAATAAVTASLSGQVVRGRTRVICADGSRKWIEYVLRPVIGADGQMLGRVSSWTDVQAQVEAERARAKAEEQFRVLAENASDVVYLTDTQARCLWMSPSVEAVLGWSPQELLGSAMVDLVHPDDVAAADRSRLDALADGVDRGVEVRYRTKAGVWRWMSAAGHVVTDEIGHVTGGVTALRDIHDVVAARQQLEASEARYRLLADNSVDVVVLADSAGVLTYVSPAVTANLGWHPDALIGTRIGDLVHPDDLPSVLKAVAKMRTDAAAHPALRARLRSADGSYRWIASTARFVRDHMGAPVEVVATWRDIAAEVEAEAALQAERSRLRATLDAELEPHVFMTAVRDAAGAIVDFVFADTNPAALAYLGVEADTFVGARLRSVFPDPHAADLLAVLAASVESGQPLVQDDFAYSGLGDGRLHRFDIRGACVGDAISLTWRDVTERHRAAAELAETQRQYRMLAENASDMVAFADTDSVVRWFSPSVATFGWTLDEVIGHRATEFIHPDDWHILAEAREASQRGGEAVAEWRFQAKDGTYRWFRVRLKPVHGPDGALLGRVSGWQDIEVERGARLALQASEERFRSLVEGTSSGLVVQAGDGAIVECNAAAEMMLGLTRQQLLGRTSVDPRWRSIHPDGSDFPGTEHPAMVALATGEPVRDVVVGVHKPDGSLTWLNVTAVPFTLPEDPALPAVVAAFTDITALVEADQQLAESEQRFRSMFDDHGAIMLLIDPVSGAIVDANGSACRLYGYDHNTLCALSIADLNLLPPEKLRQRLSRVAAGQWDSFHVPHRLADGTVRTVEVHSSPITTSEGPLLYSIIHDVTDADAARAALADSEEQFRRLAESIGDIVATYDGLGRCTWISPSVRRILGYEPETLVGGYSRDLIHPDDRESPNAELQAAVLAQQPTAPSQRMRARHVDGHYLWVETLTSFRYDDTGALLEVFAVTRNVDAQVRAETALARLVRTDTLTGLLTRAEALRQMAAILAHPPRTGHRIAIAYCDLDGMKSVNDSQGHAAGDLLLRATADRIRRLVREGDLVARIGGDELLLVLTGIRGVDDALHVAEKIRVAVAEPIPGLHGSTIASTVSIGVAFAERDDTVDTVVARADAAMYRAKRGGGNRIATES